MAGGGVADKALGALDTSKFYPVVTFLLAAIALGSTVFVPGGFIAGAIVVYLVLPVKFFYGEYITPNTPAGKMLGMRKSNYQTEEGESGEENEAGKLAGQATVAASKGAKALLGKAGPIAALMYFITPMKESEKITTMFGAVLYPVAFAAHITLLAYITYTVCDAIPGVPSSWCAAVIDYFK